MSTSVMLEDTKKRHKTDKPSPTFLIEATTCSTLADIIIKDKEASDELKEIAKKINAKAATLCTGDQVTFNGDFSRADYAKLIDYVRRNTKDCKVCNSFLVQMKTDVGRYSTHGSSHRLYDRKT